MSRDLPFLLSADPRAPFPAAALALTEPDGLLAIGGDLTPQRLLNAYRNGIFPWFSEGQPLLWWSPDPRMVFDTNQVKLSSRFRRGLRHSSWIIRADTAFEQVIAACALATRPGQDGTWITQEMQQAYTQLHHSGHAHSVEVFDGERLVGGIYGVAIGRMFFGESMFSTVSGGSKVAIYALALTLNAWGWPLMDAQVHHPHLVFLGARTMTREAFLRAITLLVRQETLIGKWTRAFGTIQASLMTSASAPSL